MVEVPLPPATASWQKSSASGNTDTECAEVTRTQGHVWVRDSKNPLGPVLRFTGEGWTAFLVGVQHDEFNRSGVSA